MNAIDIWKIYFYGKTKDEIKDVKQIAEARLKELKQERDEQNNEVLKNKIALSKLDVLYLWD
jgi:hypothetical protein